MNCESCGTELPLNARFCFKCGTSIDSTVAAETPHAAAPDSVGTGSATAVAEPTAPASSAPFAQSHPGQSARSWSEADRRPFRYGGRWWAKASTGDVLAWDEGRNTWEAPLSALTPFFMRRKPFASLQTPAMWLYILFGVFLFMTVIGLVADATLINAATGLDGDDPLIFSDASGENDGFEAVKGFQAFSILLIPAFFIWWLRRATLNLPSFGSAGQGFGGGWAIGAWFIPFANVVLPLMIVNQAWRGSDPDLPTEENTLWKSGGRSTLVIFWWVAYLISGSVWSFSTSVATDADATVSDALTAGWSGVAGDILLGTAGILALLLVVRLTRRQEAANRRFDTISAEA